MHILLASNCYNNGVARLGTNLGDAPSWRERGYGGQTEVTLCERNSSCNSNLTAMIWLRFLDAVMYNFVREMWLLMDLDDSGFLTLRELARGVPTITQVCKGVQRVCKPDM